MTASFHIAVFARAPLAGKAKTRLIPLLGEEGAAAAQRAMIVRTLTTASEAAPGMVSLWTAGNNQHPFFEECADRFRLSCYPQCEGDLGMRMADCLRILLREHDAVLLIGTDCPVLTAHDLRAAAALLRQGAQMAITPAEDGGYVLVGAKNHGRQGLFETALTAAFEAIDWGTSEVMKQTRARLRAIGWEQGKDWQELPTLWDVDTPADYVRAQQDRLLDR